MTAVSSAQVLKQAAHEVKHALLTAFPQLISTIKNPLVSRWRTLVVTVWVLAVLADGATTWFMMQSGSFEEANPVAAVGMGFAGVGGYIVLASLYCIILAAFSVAEIKGVYAAAFVVTMCVAGSIKLYTAGSNLHLWWSITQLSM